ncbi:hypothetical protein M8523_26825, partial [Hyphomicrobiales bacterium BP6-180914]|nr:hypothetical protein [Lichenifustis flavocetrariae]
RKIGQTARSGRENPPQCLLACIIRASKRSNIAAVGDFTVIPGLTQVFRRELLIFQDIWLLSIDPQKPAERLAHDQWFLFVAHTFSSTHYCNRRLLGYRQHDDNTYGIKSAISRTTDILHSPPQPTSRLHAFQSKLINKRNLVLAALDGREAASANRVVLLEEMKRISCVAQQASVIDKNIARYKGLSSNLGRRREIYRAGKTSQRLMRLASALRFKAYGISPRGCKDFLLDFVLSNFNTEDDFDRFRPIHRHLKDKDA